MNDRRRWIPFLLALLAIASIATGVSAGCHKCTVKSYVSALNEHDTEKALSMIADELHVSSPDGEQTLDRATVRKMLGWDTAIKAAVRYEDLESEGETVRAVLVERNEFYRLLGIEERRFRVEFEFESDRIRAMRLTPAGDDGIDTREALEPFLGWASARYPDTLRAIYPEGSFVFDAETAKTWLTLLREWRAG